MASRCNYSALRRPIRWAVGLVFTLLITLQATQPSTADPQPLLRDGANPYVSFLPTGATPDMRRWNRVMHLEAVARRHDIEARGLHSMAGMSIAESEPNDSGDIADVVIGFGTGDGDMPSIDVIGSFAARHAPQVLGTFAEDEGSILLASDTSLAAGGAVTISGTIGDGPFGASGTGTGDFDFFEIPGVELGQVILIDIATPLPMDDLDTFIALYDADGNIVKLNEDQDSTTFDSFMAVPAPADGDYYLAIGGSVFPFAALLSDPFDSSSGTGVGSEGDYEVTIRLESGDQDWFSVQLETCDILGLNLLDAGDHLVIQDPNGVIAVASAQDLSAAYPPASPLPGGGRVAAAHVAQVPGTYRIRAIGTAGSYTLEMRALRHPDESSRAPKVLFIDFDGATLNTSIFIGAPSPRQVELSPLSDFLSNWGLAPSDEDSVINATLATLRENLINDPFALGPNPNFNVELRNSRDHADTFGQPGVSRLIIGGSIGELGIPTIGIAQSIDVGNLEGAETAVILLDLLSRAPPAVDSLNSFPLAPGASMIDFIGVALGNIAAHEAGHYTGSFHTEQLNTTADLMDRGGNLPNTLGIGADGIYGNEDDQDVDFGVDNFVDSEGFAGFEDTLGIVACGCTTNATLFADGFESGGVTLWSASTQ